MRRPPQTREEWIRSVWAPLLVPFLVNCCLWHFAREWLLQDKTKITLVLFWMAAITLIAYPLPWKLSLKNILRSSTHGSARGPSFSTSAIGFLFPVVNSVGFRVMGEHYSLPLNAFFQLLNLMRSFGRSPFSQPNAGQINGSSLRSRGWARVLTLKGR